jgi:FkbM family methyltransferase
MDDEIAHKLYDKNREYVIVETSHDSGFNPANKRFFSDHLALISQWQIDKFKDYDIPITLLESDIEYKTKTQNQREEGLLKLGLDPKKKHVLNVGLWTSRKNQAEVLEYAKELERYPEIEFHFVGNQAPNFEHYWGPLIHNLPSNVQVWGERSDVNSFYECMDLFLFTSRGTNGDMETSPLVLREATGHQMPILMYNLPVYLNYYDKFPNIKYLTDFKTNINQILTSLNMQEQPESKLFRIQYVKDENKVFVYYNEKNPIDVSISVADIDSKHAIYAFDGKFQDYSSVWCVPIPVPALNKMNVSGYFRGYEINFWNIKRDTIIESHTVWYNENAPYFERVLFPTDPFNLTWINYTEMFVEKFYNPLQMEITGTCLDIGANDGLYTEYLLRNGADKVYAIECDPRSIKFLNNRFNDNEKVVVVDKAMWSSNETNVKLSFRTDTSTVSSLVHDAQKHGHSMNYEHDGFYEVNTWDYKTLLSKMNITKVNFFKIDIEGAEYNVFKSMSDEDIQNIDGFMVEVHWNDNGKIYQITDRLEQLGFEIELRRHTEDNAIVEKQDWSKYWMCTFYASKKKEPRKFSLVIHHLQTTLLSDVEKKSRDKIDYLIYLLKKDSRFSEVKWYRHMNAPWSRLPTTENCSRPNAVSMELFPNGINQYGETALTPAHYGCFRAFNDAIQMKFNQDFSATMIFEGDADIQNVYAFIECLYIALCEADKNEIDFISFGGAYHLETGELLAHPVQHIDSLHFGWISKHVPFAHSIIIPQRYIRQMMHAFATEPWDAADLFFINHFKMNPNRKQFVSESQLSYQIDGYSLIDKKVKNYLIK